MGLGIGLFLVNKFNECSWQSTLGVIMTIFFGIVTTIGITTLFACRYQTKASIVKFESFRETLEKQRADNPNLLERATIAKEIIDHNGWLAEEKFYNNGPFDIWIHDDIKNVEPIK